jgi:predicted nucleic acid-binding protein
MFNYYFDKNREAHFDTVKLFKDIQSGKYEAYTSIYVTDELAKAVEPKRSNMLSLIQEYDITVLPADEEAQSLTDLYIETGIIPVKYRYDGLHIAIATVNGLDFIFSLNYQHINKVKTKTLTGLINVKEGYPPITIASPMEVMEYDEE